MKKAIVALILSTILIADLAYAGWVKDYSRKNMAYPTQPKPLVSNSSITSTAYNKPRTDLGRLSSNKYASDSVSNPYGQHGSSYSPTSINNPYGKYGSQYSTNSVNNQYATNTPKIYTPDGTYLGKLSSNKYDSESVSNPYGKYGSRYSSTSINNPYSKYGSKYSSQSVNNPYASSSNAPIVLGD